MPPEELAAGELRNRAAAGAALLGARGVVIYAVGIVANLVLARLLVPRDFGLVALGTSVLVFGIYLAYGGFGAALIRRRDPPTPRELEAVFGLQLVIATVIALAVSAAALPAGNDGLVVATMAAGIPLVVLRTPAVILLERRLEYRVIATSDVAEGLAYYVWAVGTVAAGLGVWGMATAVIVRAIVGTAILVIAGPIKLVRPRWAWGEVRPLLGFGLKFQAATVVLIAREQLLNVAIATVAGLATLGVWNLAWRVLQVPTLLFATIGRVAFPALSRLLNANEDPRPAVERSLAVLAATTGILVVAMVSLAPGLPTVVGEGWEGVPAVLLWSGIALIVAAPISVVGAGYLYAAGEPGAVALATLASSVVWLGVTLPLLDSAGAAAVGIGWVPASLVHSALVWRRTVELTGAARLGPARRGALPALAGAGAGWLVAQSVDPPLVGAAIGLAVGEAIALSGLLIFARSALRDLSSMARSLWT
jgi:O-antigen/teichoic acid export membrane protein